MEELRKWRSSNYEAVGTTAIFWPPGSLEVLCARTQAEVRRSDHGFGEEEDSDDSMEYC